MVSQDLVVYSALFGRYESIVEQPVARTSSARFVMLTDNSRLDSETWEVRVVDPALGYDPVRSARYGKIMAYQMFAPKLTLWIDNRVRLKTDPYEFVPAWLASADIALPLHDHRSSLEEEFRAVRRYALDEGYRVRMQEKCYRAARPEVLDARPLWTAIIARRATEPVASAMSRWWAEVLRHSRRDQLSLPFAMAESELSPNAIPLPNRESELHQWIVAEDLAQSSGRREWTDSSYTPLAYLVDLLRTRRTPRRVLGLLDDLLVRTRRHPR